MRIPQLRMESSFMQIGLQTEQPVQRIEQPKAIIEMEQPKAIVEMETTPATLTIDQSQALAEQNRKPILEVVRDTATLGKQSVLEGTGRRAQEGRELMEIEKGGNPIITQAVEHSKRPEKQLAIGWIPSHGSVKIHYEPAKVDIRVTPQKPIIEAIPQKPIHDYTPGNVSVYIRQWNSLKIEVVHLFDESV
ncbi:DUF6470 family protein [Fervidibacillus halotolerans]|uniref:DUF6470 family protein n=1 Tax=Fervidibacillus halotolerans TaxID=2980027 RepID=A0A9E8LYE1_9BACI|nr:DUF6470 family protein [Fervidibacillus halotolerans]WAA12025.1 DUF6470 family protein [Fervidibacillus halotolerans]